MAVLFFYMSVESLFMPNRAKRRYEKYLNQRINVCYVDRNNKIVFLRTVAEKMEHDRIQNRDWWRAIIRHSL